MYVFGRLNVNQSHSKSLASIHVYLQQILYGSCRNIIDGDNTFVMIMFADTLFEIDILSVMKFIGYQIFHGGFFCVYSAKNGGAIKKSWVVFARLGKALCSHAYVITHAFWSHLREWSVWLSVPCNWLGWSQGDVSSLENADHSQDKIDCYTVISLISYDGVI